MTVSTEKSIQSDIALLIDSTLTEVALRVYSAEFLFLGNMSIRIRINKVFNFRSNTAEGRFDPSKTVHDLGTESTNFVLLRGLQCRNAHLDHSRFELSFEEGAKLWIELGEKDFEPLELIGASGERHEKMEFYYVL